MKLCRWSSLDLNSLFLWFLWSCYSNFLLFVSILLVMRNSSFLPELLRMFGWHTYILVAYLLHSCQSCCVCLGGILTLWWHTYIKSTENSCIPYCCYGWNTTHTCSLSTPWARQQKCWRKVRTCMQSLPRPWSKILPRSDH